MTGTQASAAAQRGAAVVTRGGRPRRNNFDGLRLLAALLVAYGHQRFGRTADPTGTDGLRLVMFFSISGFLVAGSWSSDPHPGRFLARRFLRIWPAYAVLVVVCAGVSWLVPAPDMPAISRMASVHYLSNLLFPGFDWGFFPARYPMMNKSLWMLPYEIDLYLAFALVAPLGRGARIGVATALLLIAMKAQPTIAATGGLLECWSPYFSGFFAFGILLREIPYLRNGRSVAACVACGVVLLCIGERTTGLLLLIPPGAVWIGERAWPVLRSAARYGDLSYGIFLWSFPVQQVTRLWLDTAFPVPLQLAVVLLQVVPIAWLSCRFVEAPALRRKPRRPAASVAGRQGLLPAAFASGVEATRDFVRRGFASAQAVALSLMRRP